MADAVHRPGYGLLAALGWYIVYQLKLAGSLEPAYLLIEAQARPRIDGRIFALPVGEHVGIPIAEALALTDFLAEDVGIDLLQRLVHDSYLADHILQVYQTAGLKLGTLMQRQDIIVQRQAHERHLLVLQQPHQTRWQSYPAETEEETHVGCGDLQERHLEPLASLEGRARLGIDAQQAMGKQVIDRTAGLSLGQYRDDTAGECHLRQLRDGLLVHLVVYLFNHLYVCFAQQR